MIKIVLLFAILIVGCAKSNTSTNQNPIAISEVSDSNCSVKFAKSKICAEINWLEPIATERGNSFNLRIWASDTSKVLSDFAPKIFLWMHSMGHGSAPVAITRLENSFYTVSKIYFIMAGDWAIHFELYDVITNEKIDEARLDLAL